MRGPSRPAFDLSVSGEQEVFGDTFYLLLLMICEGFNHDEI